jgi:16S rRNA processing protein RimM
VLEIDLEAGKLTIDPLAAGLVDEPEELSKLVSEKSKKKK